MKVRGYVALLEDVDAATPNDVADASVRQNMNLVIPPEHPLAKINQLGTGVTYSQTESSCSCSSCGHSRFCHAGLSIGHSSVQRLWKYQSQMMVDAKFVCSDDWVRSLSLKDIATVTCKPPFKTFDFFHSFEIIPSTIKPTFLIPQRRLNSSSFGNRNNGHVST